MIFHGSDVGATDRSPFLRKKLLTLPLFTLTIVVGLYRGSTPNKIRSRWSEFESQCRQNR